MSLKWGHINRAQLDSELCAELEAVLGPLKETWLVTQGRRTYDEQASLWASYKAGGPKAAPPGSSPHEFGLAVDVALYSNEKASWDVSDPAWPKLWAAVSASRLLHSGRHFGDPDHIERVAWRRSLATTRK